MTETIIQLGLAIFGLAALAMALSNNQIGRKWAPFVGLAGQPFWFWYALNSAAWGLLVLAAAYTLTFAIGAWVQWRAA